MTAGGRRDTFSSQNESYIPHLLSLFDVTILTRFRGQLVTSWFHLARTNVLWAGPSLLLSWFLSLRRALVPNRASQCSTCNSLHSALKRFPSPIKSVKTLMNRVALLLIHIWISWFRFFFMNDESIAGFVGFVPVELSLLLRTVMIQEQLFLCG